MFVSPAVSDNYQDLSKRSTCATISTEKSDMLEMNIVGNENCWK